MWLGVYGMLGRAVAVVEEGLRSSGEHVVRFDAAGLPAGVYLVRLATEAGARAAKVVVR